MATVKRVNVISSYNEPSDIPTISSKPLVFPVNSPVKSAKEPVELKKYIPILASPAQVRIWHPEIGNKKITKALRRQTQQEINTFVDKVSSDLEHERMIKNLQQTIYTYVPRDFVDPKNPVLEIFINLVLFIASLAIIDWTTYLMYYKGGRKIVTDLFFLPDKTKAYLNFTKTIKTMYISGISTAQIILFLRNLGLPEFLQHSLTVVAVDQIINAIV